MEERKAIASHSTAISAGTWDGPANKARLDNDGDAAYYRKAFAWQDPDGDANAKGSYKFIHHEVAADGEVGAANMTGCSAGIAVLNGGRGGANIPDEDRRGVWNHLARHLRDDDREPPDLRMAEMSIEKRFFDVTVEDRADGGSRIKGYAAVFNQLSLPLGGFRERILPGAFSESIQQDDIRALFNHDPNFVLGRNRSGTLTLREDNVGLYFEVAPPPADWARDLVTSIRRGDITGASFSFRALDDSFSSGEGDELIRDVIKAQVFDASPVTYPAYPQTQVSAHRDMLRTAMASEARSAEERSLLRRALGEGPDLAQLARLRQRLEVRELRR